MNPRASGCLSSRPADAPRVVAVAAAAFATSTWAATASSPSLLFVMFTTTRLSLRCWYPDWVPPDHLSGSAMRPLWFPSRLGRTVQAGGAVALEVRGEHERCPV
jgi:hypothetical protein